jgi:hypothetical protein
MFKISAIMPQAAEMIAAGVPKEFDMFKQFISVESSAQGQAVVQSLSRF